MRFSAQNSLDGVWAVEARCHCSAEGFDACDGRGGGSGYNDVDRGLEFGGVLFCRISMVQIGCLV